MALILRCWAFPKNYKKILDSYVYYVIISMLLYAVLANAGLRGEGYRMSEIRVKDNESLDSALRRFKRSCAKAGVLSEVRKREHYEKPSVKRKKKSEAARKRKFK